MKNPQINPLLVSVLTGKTIEEIPTSPKLSDLPGNFVKIVAKNSKMINYRFESNTAPLICKSCGKKAIYDLGLLTVNISKNTKDVNEVQNQFQLTGYFRCKNCNSAGDWESTPQFKMLFITAVLAASAPEAQNRFSYGKSQLFDGSSHKYASDAEEHLLKKIMANPEDSFLWNRLGNLYQVGGRADLASCAFEQSIHLDPLQTESHYSLGMILTQVGEPLAAANHFYKMLVSSRHYDKMPAENSRDLLANGLRELFNYKISSNSDISLVPPRTIYEELSIDFAESIQTNFNSLDLLLSPDELDSFYPLAEIFMGKRSNEIPGKIITKYFKQKKKKKKKKKTK